MPSEKYLKIISELEDDDDFLCFLSRLALQHENSRHLYGEFLKMWKIPEILGDSFTLPGQYYLRCGDIKKIFNKKSMVLFRTNNGTLVCRRCGLEPSISVVETDHLGDIIFTKCDGCNFCEEIRLDWRNCE